jgi:TusA-related sulfurtransferase
MGIDGVLDLTDLDWPVSLLRFNDALKRWPPDSTLEVWIRDPRVVESVKMIAQNTDHRITRIDQANDTFRMCVRRIEHLPPTIGRGSSGNE